MAKTFSSTSEKYFIKELRHQLITKIATNWEIEWAKEHGETFSTIDDLPSKNAFYIDLEDKIKRLLLEKFNYQTITYPYVTRHTLARFLDENYAQGFEIQTSLNPITQYCGYDQWEQFKELNPEPLPTEFLPWIIPRGGIPQGSIIVVQLPPKPNNWKLILSSILMLAGVSLGLYYYFYKYLPFRTLTKEEISTFSCELVRQESDQGRNPLKAYFKYDFSKLKLDSLNVYFGGNKGVAEHDELTLTKPKGEFVFDYYKAGVHELTILHQKKEIKRLIVLVKSHGWSCWYLHLTPSDRWTNTNFKYADFYTDGYLHVPRERITPNHRDNYSVELRRTEDFAVGFDSTTIEYKQKNSPNEEAISYYTLDIRLENEFGKSLSANFNRNTGKEFIANLPPTFSNEDPEINRQGFEIPMICYDWTKVKMVIKHDKVQLWINDKLWTNTTMRRLGGKLKTINLNSKGSGKWDDFKVWNSYTGKVIFEDNFEKIPESKDGY